MSTNEKKHYKSSTQKKRDSYPYREEYFKRNPGLFGFLYFCGNCGKPLFGRDQVQVDHIWSLKGGGINRTFNANCLCEHCNKVKGSKVTGAYLIKGYSSKIVASIIFTVQKIIFKLLSLVLILLFTLACIPMRVIKNIWNNGKLSSKLIVVGAIAYLLYCVYTKFNS